MKLNGRPLAVCLLLTLALTMLSACASGPPAKYSLENGQYDQSKMGIVIGKITKQRFFGDYNADSWFGTYLGFANTATGESIDVTFANNFELILPAGTYQLKAIGSPAGPLIPKILPFSFSVQPGAVKYVGSIVGDRDLLRHMEAKGIAKDRACDVVISAREYGVARPKELFSSERVASKPYIAYFIIDEKDAVVQDFIARYPAYKYHTIIPDFMR